MEEYKGINPLRGTSVIRSFLYRETISCDDLVMPILIQDEANLQSPIPTVTIELLGSTVKELYSLGIKTIKLFGKGVNRSENGREALSKESLIIQAISEAKASVPEICVITETCLCPYTLDRACVIYDKNRVIDYKATNEIFAGMALLHAVAGADIVGPAAVCDGTIKSVRGVLNTNGFRHIPVIPHLIINSNLFSIYRKVMDIQNDHRNALHLPNNDINQIIEAAKLMVNEGANMLMLEPCLFTMDILAILKMHIKKPIGVFSVSGEYNTLYTNYSADDDFRQKIIMEFIRSVKRSGATFIVTYLAPYIAKMLN